jgi:hypothetical protein
MDFAAAKDCEKPFAGKYAVHDRVFVKIGSRPLMSFRIIECVKRRRPHYRFDWAEHGFNAILNTVAIPESSVVGPVN